MPRGVGLQEGVDDLLKAGALIEEKELVFTVVRSIGTELSAVEQHLRARLLSAGYAFDQPIKLSRLLGSVDVGGDLETSPEHVRYRSHMDLGDHFRSFARQHTKLNTAVALLGVREIAERRRQARAEAAERGDANENAPRGRGFLLLSLMHPDEIRLFRSIYRSQAFVIAASSSQESRLESLADDISRTTGRGIDECKSIALDLINRDAGMELAAGAPGLSPHPDVARQMRSHASARVDVSRTYELADIFVSPENRAGTERTLTRFVDLIFSHQFHTPTADELGMYAAYGMALRSGSLSRRVGAVICTEDGDLVAGGTNDVPRYGGGLYWSEEEPDERDHRRRVDTNDVTKAEIMMDLFERLQRQEWLRPPNGGTTLTTHLRDFLADDILNQARALDVIEYGRAVHAEMAAISDAARRGVPTQGTTLYCTTFPCHECARHIVAAGVERVVYIEAYAKSRVAQLYRDSIGLVERHAEIGERVRFEPFVGIGPSRFNDLFSWVPRKKADAERRKDLSGEIAAWSIATAEVRNSIISQAREYFQAQLLGARFAERRSVRLIDELVDRYAAQSDRRP